MTPGYDRGPGAPPRDGGAMDDVRGSRLVVATSAESSESPRLTEEQERLLAYWERLAAVEDPPAWRGFDPLEVWTLVPCLVLYQILDGGDDLLIRLPGGDFEERVGRSLRGRRLGELYPVSRLGSARAAVKAMLADPRPRLVAGSMTLVDREHHHYTRLSLPFTETVGGPVSLILAHYGFEA